MNKSNLKKVSLLLRKKSTSYLKVSFVIFVISLVIVASISVVGISQYANLQQEFIKMIIHISFVWAVLNSGIDMTV